MTDSILPFREQLLQQIATVFSTTVGQSGTVFKRVFDSPPEGREFKGANTLAILEGVETYIDVVSPDKRDRRLEVELAAFVYVPMGTSLRQGANAVLADMEKITEENYLWGNLSYATDFLSNTVFRENTTDRYVEVSLFIAVRYRTKRSNPRARTS